MSYRFLLALPLVFGLAAVAQPQDSQSQPDPAACHIGKTTTAPRARYTPGAPFSDEARKKHIDGTVLLKIVVATDGSVHDITVTKGLGYGLDEQAVKTVGTWRFDPATRISDGEPVACGMSVEVTFRYH